MSIGLQVSLGAQGPGFPQHLLSLDQNASLSLLIPWHWCSPLSTLPVTQPSSTAAVLGRAPRGAVTGVSSAALPRGAATLPRSAMLSPLASLNVFN